MNENYTRTLMTIFEDLVKPSIQIADRVVAFHRHQDCVPIFLCSECFDGIIEDHERHDWKPMKRSEALEPQNKGLDCDCCFDPIVVD